MNKFELQSFFIIPFPEKKKRMKWKDFKIFTKFSKKSKFPLQYLEMKCKIEVGNKKVFDGSFDLNISSSTPKAQNPVEYKPKKAPRIKQIEVDFKNF